MTTVAAGGQIYDSLKHGDGGMGALIGARASGTGRVSVPRPVTGITPSAGVTQGQRRSYRVNGVTKDRIETTGISMLTRSHARPEGSRRVTGVI